jgi:hypothetical protein
MEWYAAMQLYFSMFFIDYISGYAVVLSMLSMPTLILKAIFLYFLPFTAPTMSLMLF